METKYYTPSIEEFHVDFEYEITYYKDKSKWEKEIVASQTFTEAGDGDWGFSDGLVVIHNFSQEDLKEGFIRVKYLDKAGIESKGFKFTNTLGDMQFFNKTIYNLSLDSNYKIIVISDKDIIFNGTIKNLSEFKKLLQQLNIK